MQTASVMPIDPPGFGHSVCTFGSRSALAKWPEDAVSTLLAVARTLLSLQEKASELRAGGRRPESEANMDKDILKGRWKQLRGSAKRHRYEFDRWLQPAGSR